MVDPILLLPILASFLVSLFFMPAWIKKARGINLVWDDMNKKESEKVAGSGGIVAVLAFSVGVFVFISYRTFILDSVSYLPELLAAMTAVLFLAGIGLVDDLLGWQKGGLRRRHRILLVILAAIPFMAINAGRSVISFPLIGIVDLGIIYPMIIIPLGIVGAATTFNFLAGFNGLEAGLGAIVLSGLGIVAFFTGNSWITVLCLCMVAALFAFLTFNWYPAKVFPGDSLTYVTGGLIAMVAILGNFEKIAVFFFIPYIIETVLKIRGKLVKHSFGEPIGKNHLSLRYDKIYSLNHLSIYLMQKLKIVPTERKVVLSLWIFQIIIVILGMLIFAGGIFR